MVQENSLNSTNGKIVVICGATCSGKSSLAISLAQMLNTEIISADSLAIYKKLDIGTAKPTLKERETVKHHLIGCVSPFDNFSVSDYENAALPITNDLLSKGKTPIICGGTGFYINSVLFKKSYGNAPKNEKIREKYKKILQEKGIDYLYSILQSVDKKSSEEIHPNNVVRVIRALEIYETTGTKKSDIIDKDIPRYNFISFMPVWKREVLYKRINDRVDKMMEDGLIDEVRGLIDDGITIENQCMQGIGYKEVYEGLKNGDLSTVGDQIKLNTRHYAKRQETFFKRMQNLISLDMSCDINYDEILSKIKE